MLTKNELDFLNNLLNKPEIKRKNLLGNFIWVNSISPKYAVNDKVKLRSGIVAVVKKVELFIIDHSIHYTLENDKKIIFASERDIKCRIRKEI